MSMWVSIASSVVVSAVLAPAITSFWNRYNSKKALKIQDKLEAIDSLIVATRKADSALSKISIDFIFSTDKVDITFYNEEIPQIYNFSLTRENLDFVWEKYKGYFSDDQSNVQTNVKEIIKQMEETNKEIAKIAQKVQSNETVDKNQFNFKIYSQDRSEYKDLIRGLLAVREKTVSGK